MIIENIKKLLDEVEQLKANNTDELEALRIKYLSKKGAINDLMTEFRSVEADKKREVGMRINELKTKAQDKINALRAQFEQAADTNNDLDLSRYA